MAKLFERKSTSLTISEFYDNFLSKKYRFDVTYQRKSGVWSEDKKSFLIDSILKNYPMPAIFLRPCVDNNTGKTVYDVVDGKQRLEAIIDFIENKIPLTTYFAEDDFIDEANLAAASQIAGLTFNEIKEKNSEFPDYIKQFWTYALNIEYLYEQKEALVASVLISAVPIGGGTISEMVIISMMGYPVSALPVLTMIATVIDAPATALNAVGDTSCSLLVSRVVDGKNWVTANHEENSKVIETKVKEKPKKKHSK